jgi:hypothetical protein
MRVSVTWRQATLRELGAAVMDRRGSLTKALVVIGSVLVWLPLIAPLVLGVVRFIQIHRVRIDYLMPAELFWVALVGGVLLLWAALRAGSCRRLVGGSLASAVGLLGASMAVAVWTGLASGAAPPTGWRVILVAGLMAGYVIALCVLALAGLSLARRLVREPGAGG